MQTEPLESHKDGYTLSTDRARLDLTAIQRFLANTSYWAQGIPLAVVQKSIENSLCFGIYYGEQQVGFARIITDYATFAWLGDVFILEEHRGKGLSKWLMKSITGHPELQGLRTWLLATRDAHGLYAQFGFKPLSSPERFMQIRNPHVYKNR